MVVLSLHVLSAALFTLSVKALDLDLYADHYVNGTSENLYMANLIDTTNDGSAVLVQHGGVLTLSHSSVFKTRDTSNETESSFYNLNAAVAVQSNSTLYVYDSVVATAGDGANGIHTNDPLSAAYIYDSVISTFNVSSHPLYVAGGGYMYAENLILTATGVHSNLIATDQGGGTILSKNIVANALSERVVFVYSTGNITVYDLQGTSTHAEAGVIDGNNSFTLYNPQISAGPVDSGVLKVFSSGSEVSLGKIWVYGGTVEESRGAVALYMVTNAAGELYLESVDIPIKSGILVNASVYTYGTEGVNGGHAKLFASHEHLIGDVVVDDISSALVTLGNSSYLAAAFNEANTKGITSLTLDASSTWNVTGTSHVDELLDDDQSLSNIISDGYTVYYNSSSSANNWLQNKTHSLSGGGSLSPS